MFINESQGLHEILYNSSIIKIRYTIDILQVKFARKLETQYTRDTQHIKTY